MSEVVSSLQARSESIELLQAELLKTEEDILAIELCSASQEQRREDRELVRRALDDGQSPSEIGLLFVAVVADLTYDVDWGDQFKFWPLLHKGLGATRLRLTDTNEDRRKVADVFIAFASKGSVATPRGAFADQFPLMSWALIHAGLPRCAHRPMARLIERATAGGILSTGTSDWPADKMLNLSATTGVPLFLQGLLEHPGVSKRIGGALLDAVAGERRSGWLRRLADDIHADKAVKDCLETAKKRLERSRVGRMAAQAGRAPSLQIILERRGDAYQLRLEIGPLEEDLAAVPGLEDFAQKHGSLRVRCGATAKPGGFLINALRSRITEVLHWQGGALIVEIEARPYEDQVQSVPQKIRDYFAQAKLERQLPALFRAETEGRLVMSPDATHGEEVAVILGATDARATALLSFGFTREKLDPEVSVIVLQGTVKGPAAEALRALGFSINPPRVSLRPILIPPLLRRPSRLVYPEGQDAWISVEGLRADAEARAVVRCGASRLELEMRQAPDGTSTVQVPARHIQAARSRLEILDAAGEALCSSDLIHRAVAISVEPTRWQATLHPNSASVEHLLANMCSLEVEALPGVQVEVELVSVVRGVVAQRIFEPPVSLFNGAKQLQSMVNHLDAAEEEERAAAGEALVMRARAIDEPGAFREIARLDPARDPLHFEPNRDHLILLSEETAAVPELWRLVLDEHGAQRTHIEQRQLREPGLYVACTGETWAAACIADTSSSSRLPRIPRLQDVRRGKDRCLEILRLLRAVDVARLWPKASLGRALLARHRAVMALEREFVAALCGLAWARREEEAAQQEFERDALLKAFTPMLWINLERVLEELDVEDDPIAPMRALLRDIGARSNTDYELAQHLLLLFYQRATASRRHDRACIEWAWSNVQRARLVRLCSLAVQDRFQRAEFDESVDEDRDA